jgi:solute carrier family 25 phosphate transporter 23/24/25/41
LKEFEFRREQWPLEIILERREHTKHGSLVSNTLRKMGESSKTTTVVSGFAAGAVSRTCTAPMDRLKVVMQTGGRLGSGANLAEQGVLRGMQSLYKEAGLRGLFVGNVVNVLKVSPELAVKFVVYEELTSWMQNGQSDNGTGGKRNISIGEKMVAGSTAGMVAQTAIYPLEVAKTKMMVAKPSEYRSIAHCLHTTWRTGGVRALYGGLNASLLGIFPYAGLDLAIFSTLRDQLPPDSGPLGILACGTVSSTFAGVVTYPLQLIRTKMQAETGRYKNAFEGLQATVRQQGVRGLYCGLIPNLLKGVPSISISYTVFETTKNAIAQKQKQYNDM